MGEQTDSIKRDEAIFGGLAHDTGQVVVGEQVLKLKDIHHVVLDKLFICRGIDNMGAGKRVDAGKRVVGVLVVKIVIMII
jgi:hypothetical protein